MRCVTLLKKANYSLDKTDFGLKSSTIAGCENVKQ